MISPRGQIGRLAELAGYRGKRWFRANRRQLFLWLGDREFAGRVSAYRRLAEAKDWQAALPKALEIATEAEQRRDRRLLDELSQALLRMGAYGRAAELKIARRHIVDGRRAGEWLGEDIAGRTLLIDLMETDKQGLATALRHASAVARAMKRARRTIVIVEHRLVPLFQRTFPGADVRPAGPSTKAAYAEADSFAGVQHLTALFEKDEAEIAAGFLPLVADSNLAAEFRQQYRGGEVCPLVGFAWGSIAPGKDLPPLSAWRPLLDRQDVRFVSLQYGNIDGDLAKLSPSGGEPIIHDRSVDQLVDMDRFAGQVAALDAVVTISNTGAHLAGALGVKTIIVLGDGFRRSWPVNSDRTPYYPSILVVGKDGKSWDETLITANARLSDILADSLTAEGNRQ